MKAPVTYIPDFVPDPDQVFRDLVAEPAWLNKGSPRLEYYCNDLNKPYVYGTGPRRKEFVAMTKTPAIQRLQDLVEHEIGVRFEVCFLNRYLNERQYVSWHADDEPEMDDSRPIAAISLGAARDVYFRSVVGTCCRCCGSENPTVHKMSCYVRNQRRSVYSPEERLTLAHGSLYVMAAGMQTTWQHRISKSKTRCGERVSATFRGYVNP